MPRKVDAVPQPWAKYMDGNIWEFTPEEMAALGSFSPMANKYGEIAGKTMIQWYVGEKYYVRFLDLSKVFLTSEELAGWEKPKSTQLMVRLETSYNEPLADLLFDPQQLITRNRISLPVEVQNIGRIIISRSDDC